MSTHARAITRHSSKSRLFLLTFLLLTCGAPWAQQPTAPEQKPTEPQKVEDLTPPSDAEMERKALEAEKSATEAAAEEEKKNPQLREREPGERQSGFLFRKKVDEVVLHATVMDAKGRFITKLGRPAFTVFEDNVAQPITSFRNEDIPVSVGLVIDNSASMRKKRPSVNQAALNFVRASNPDDEVFVVNFDFEANLDQDYTADLVKLKDALDQIQARSTTALYDAVYAAAGHLHKGARRDKKVLLVVTDGEDNASQLTLEETLRFLQEDFSDVTVYMIGLLEDEDRKVARKAKRAMNNLAQTSGGMAYFPEKFEEVDAVTKDVAYDIRNQYAIGYKPLRPLTEAGFRSVRVEVKAGGQKVAARTRSGYYAGPQKQATAKPEPVKPKK
ncbi:MAG: VWA domain-containing protein [Acidobacteriales bacterium]|nr:VWA domain-containing protein [Terriglobales bacterium]